MFYSEQLLSKEGPLAHVWLAANLERKLTKHQLLSTDIAESSEAIVASSSAQNNLSMDSEPMALRLTGTLLYGIVKIYSRKAKYLLDDVSEALMRLKTAFRSSNNIILPPQLTLIPSVKQVLLQDTVTANDLLWQEPLNLDDDPLTRASDFGLAENSFDRSVEVGRGVPEIDDLAGHHDDDLQLDFDLGDAGFLHDLSVEVGRDRELSALEEPSVLPDLTFGGLDEPALEMGPDFGGADFDQPQTPTGDAHSADILALPSPVHQQKKRSNKFAESDVVRTSKRRLVFDQVIELTSSQIRDQLQNPASCDFAAPLEPTVQQRMDQITSSTQFRSLKLQISHQLAMASLNTVDDQLELANSTHQLDFNDQPAGLDFDFVPEPVLQDLGDGQQLEEQLNLDEVLEFEDLNTEDTAGKVLELIQGHPETTFSEVVARTGAEVRNPKSHATSCFFELLVLASGSQIALKQDALFGEISIASH